MTENGKTESALPQEVRMNPQPSVEELLHELQVHQIELVMQNESLRDAQAALEKSRDRYLDLYDFSPVGYVTVTAAGLISSANLSAASLLHLDRRYMLQMRFEKLVVREDRDRWQQCFKTLKQHGGRTNLELSMHGRNGTLLHVHMDCLVQHIPENTDLTDPPAVAVEVRIALLDITQRKQAELALRDSEWRYRVLFESTQDAIFVIADVAVSMVNPAGLHLLQACEQDQVLGRDPMHFIHPDYRSLAEQRAARCLTQGMPNPPVEMVFLRVDGSPVDVETVSVPMYIQGKSAMQIMARDISDRKQADRARRETQRERRINAQRLAAMSRHMVAVQEELRRRLARELHDRTKPNLAAIGINLEVAATALEKVGREEIDMRMEDTLALLDDTWESIRDICADLRPPALDHAGLAAAVDAYASQYSRRNAINVSLSCMNPEVRLTSELESVLFRIVQEALINTARHAQAKNVQISLQFEQDQVRLELSDDGCGFDPATLNTSSRFGIFSMREMADFSGGSFHLHSSPGAGTRIRVTIPMTTTQP